MEYTRRNFLKTTGVATALTPVSNTGFSMGPQPLNAIKPVTIAQVDSQFEQEPLIRPFGSKGGYMSEISLSSRYTRMCLS